MLGDVGTKPESPVISQLQQVMAGRWQWVAPEEPDEEAILAEAEISAELLLVEAELSFSVRQTTPMWIIALVSKLCCAVDVRWPKKRQPNVQIVNYEPPSLDVGFNEQFQDWWEHLREESWFTCYKAILHLIMVDIPMWLI
jgi:hypothetical protein